MTQADTDTETAPRIRTGLDYTLRHLAVLQWRIHQLVTDRSNTTTGLSPLPRGLFISDETATQLSACPTQPVTTDPTEDTWVEQTEELADNAEAQGIPLPLRDLATAYDLEPADRLVLLAALAPEIDPRFGQLYGYLHDDSTRQHASCGLALQLCAAEQHDPHARSRLTHGPLITHRLLQVSNTDWPFPARSLILSDRITAHLLDQPWPPHALSPGITLTHSTAPPPPSPATKTLVDQVHTALAQGKLVHLQGPVDSCRHTVAEAALHTLSPTLIHLDLSQLHDPATAQAAVAEATLEARLRHCGLLISPLPRTTTSDDTDTTPNTPLTPLSDTPVPTVTADSRPWSPYGCTRRPLELTCPTPTTAERTTAWDHELRPHIPDPTERHTTINTLRPYRLSPTDITQTVRTAHALALARHEPLSTPHLQTAARRHRPIPPSRLTRRIQPTARWDDLVLPDLPKRQLQDLIHRAQYREQVLRDWKMNPGSMRGTSTIAMFTGESGTGKTLAAETIATTLGLDLCHINLATIVDKYIGETEKRLDQVFEQIENTDALLLFDEADALFGKRSETTSAHDRYANIETAYLLQRLETFNGIAILTTNLSANIDQAFTRRLDLIIHFPPPTPHLRHRLWSTCLPSTLPRTPDIDLKTLATTHNLTGGSIRNCAITTAYHIAARNTRPLTQNDLENAINDELRKLGRTPPPE